MQAKQVEENVLARGTEALRVEDEVLRLKFGWSQQMSQVNQ